jgi:hypothetical protein
MHFGNSRSLFFIITIYLSIYLQTLRNFFVE